MSRMAAQIPGKVESNLKERARGVRSAASRELTIGRTFISDLVALRPVKAVTDVVTDTLDNAGDLVKVQADVTRRWLSG